jgi:hypothetical protein
MADFSLWATAAEASHEQGKFIQAYQRNRQCAIESGLEGSPVASALRTFMDSRVSWEGTATNLLNELSHYAGERTRMQRSWPKSAKGLSGQLRRLATALRAVGIEIEHSRDGKAGTRNIHIKKACKKSSEPSDSSATVNNQRFKADASLTQGHKTDASQVPADASEDELSPCSDINADASDDADAYSQDASNARRIWTTPTFEYVRIAEGAL